MGEEETCERCGLTDESVIDLDIGITCHRELNHCITALREENDNLRVELEDANKALFDEGKLQCDTVEMHFDPKGTASVVKGLKEKNITLESEVKRYREALEKIFKLKVPEHKDCVAYDIASSALSEGESE